MAQSLEILRVVCPKSWVSGTDRRYDRVGIILRTSRMIWGGKSEAHPQHAHQRWHLMLCVLVATFSHGTERKAFLLWCRERLEARHTEVIRTVCVYSVSEKELVVAVSVASQTVHQTVWVRVEKRLLFELWLDRFCEIDMKFRHAVWFVDNHPDGCLRSWRTNSNFKQIKQHDCWKTWR